LYLYGDVRIAMELIPSNLECFPTLWIREKVTALLALSAQTPADLRQFDGDDSIHFVMGTDKQGVLWTTPGAMVEQPAQYFTAVTYHPPAMQTETMVHGGAITAVIDAFAAGCGAIALRFPMAIATAEQTVKFRRPVALGEPYLLHCWHDAEAISAESRNHTAEVAGELLDKEGTILAESRSVIKVPRFARSQE
jgi:acyl-coenzyme A thioesterase PaaI-like protein